MSELTEEPITTQTEPIATLDDIHTDDPDDEWSSGPVRSGLRLRAPTAVLIGLLVLAGGFWGGALAQKHHGSSSSSSALSALASRFAAAGGTTGTGATGFSGASGAATSGIVTGVQGQTLYVTDASGALVKVNVGPSTTISRTAKSSLAGLQTGDTVIVTGTKSSNGTVTATAVRATGAGVTTSTGFGGTGFGGGGAAGG